MSLPGLDSLPHCQRRKCVVISSRPVDRVSMFKFETLYVVDRCLKTNNNFLIYPGPGGNSSPSEGWGCSDAAPSVIHTECLDVSVSTHLGCSSAGGLFLLSPKVMPDEMAADVLGDALNLHLPYITCVHRPPLLCYPTFLRLFKVHVH